MENINQTLKNESRKDENLKDINNITSKKLKELDEKYLVKDSKEGDSEQKSKAELYEEGVSARIHKEGVAEGKMAYFASKKDPEDFKKSYLDLLQSKKDGHDKYVEHLSDNEVAYEITKRNNGQVNIGSVVEFNKISSKQLAERIDMVNNGEIENSGTYKDELEKYGDTIQYLNKTISQIENFQKQEKENPNSSGNWPNKFDGLTGFLDAAIEKNDTKTIQDIANSRINNTYPDSIKEKIKNWEAKK